MKTISIFLIFFLFFINASALDLSIRECREMALSTDEELRIAENNLSSAELTVGVARTAYLPKLDGNGALLYNTPDNKMGDAITLQMRGVYMAGISLTQPIYTGGKIIAANKMATIGKEITKEQLRAARMNAIAEAERSYWTYVAVLSKVEMMTSYLSMMDSIYEMTQLSVKTGLTARPALLRVESRRSEVIYRLEQAKTGADMCRMALCRIIGQPDTTTIVPTESLESDFDAEIPNHSFSLDSRPELSMLKKTIDIKNQDVKMIRADFLPTVGLQIGWWAYGNTKMKSFAQDPNGNYIPVSSSMNDNGFIGMLAVQIPIFHWGEGIKKIKKAKIEVENARLSLERNRRLMRLEANQNYNNLVTSATLVESAKKAMAEADENLQIMKEQYEIGMTTLTDLLEAQSQWHTSYSNFIEARTQYRINHVDFLRSIGELN